MATVKLFGTLRKTVEPGSSLQLPGKDVQAVLVALCEHYPLVAETLYENGDIRPYFRITLNGIDIGMSKGLDTPVSDGDRISIFSPIAGG